MQEFLNWQTDPLLVDPEPLAQNTWLTANNLLESNQSEKIFTANNQFNLYSIMIRKNDFVTGERIIQSFPYIILDQELITKIRKHSLALAEKTYNYFQKSHYTRSIRDWQKKIIAYLEKQQRLPFPLFRLVPSYEKFFQEKQTVNFQSARGEDFQLPLYLTENLAYLTGVVIGDGHLADYFINIIDSSKVHIENLTRLLEELFKSKTEFFEQPNANAWNVNILGKWVVRFFNFLSSQPIAARKYLALREPLIFQSNDLFRSLFWRGLMDADGSYKRVIGVASASKRLRSDFATFLTQHQIDYRFYEQEVCGGLTYSLNVAGQSRKQFAKLIGSNHPDKQQELQSLLSRKVYRFSRRIHTVRKIGTWHGQVIGFKHGKLASGYFDFSNFPINIVNKGKYIRKLRLSNEHTQAELAEKLNIAQGMLSKYESNTISIPIHTFLVLLQQYHLSMENLLSEYSILTFQLSKSSCCFPVKPKKKLLNLMAGLQFKDNGYFYIIGGLNISLEEYKQALSNYFLITIPSSMKFYNAVLRAFYKEFFVLRD
ncbi:MAG: helix-turn-helix domain-containing protein [Candidatus Heimdallarchaeota archaeon]